ncbi:TIGR02147 family protein [Bdellovibrio bacteriovorus]|uniref:TIGR02147 family protein n=1 Tax=Bdellovibrio bacteriovorus TaxID=959 RepID=UPI0021CE68D6|nr:TIGR02147 family protein [Bdellovibrio bacteriovorus]UXR64806.1 TIGR02147 family protein [Bdellovibrio bacteriovorus]
MKSKRIQARSFKQLLQEELVARCRSNPNYSLRSFARSLQVEPSALSQMINGKRPITEKMKMRLGSALGLTTDQLRRLPASAEAMQGHNEIRIQFQQLTMDSFAVISDWYHYAILELTYLEDFKSDAIWIAQRLGITKSEVNIAVNRLLRLGLLKKNEKGKWIDASENGELTHLSPSETSDAARKYQIQLLELSQNAVREIAVKKRNHTSATLCFDPEDLELAIERIADFRRSFARDFQPKKAKDVYQLQISFFPLTKQKDNV